MRDKPAWAFVVPWELTPQGGVNQVVLRLMRECSQSERFQPLLIEMNWESREPVEDTHLGFPRVRVRAPSPLASPSLAVDGGRYLLRWPAEKNVLRSLAERLRIAVVNPHFPELTAWPWLELLYENRLPERLILSFHGSDIRAAFKKGWLYRNFYRRLLRRASGVVACSRGLLEEIRMLEPALGNGTAVLNGVSPSQTTSAAPALRPSGSPLVVTVGRFEYRKGHDVLLRAFEMLLQPYPQAELWIIGGAGEELEKTRALIDARRLSGQVKLLVGIEQARVAPTIRQANVFVMSSRWVRGKLGEGLPLAILEAGAEALPVVSTRCCGADEVIDDGRTGVLTPLDDAGELAKALESMLSNPERARGFGLALRERVEREFTWLRAWREYEALA